MENVKYMLQEASVKMKSSISDIEDLTILKNHNVNILDVLDDLKKVRETILYIQDKIDRSHEN